MPPMSSPHGGHQQHYGQGQGHGHGHGGQHYDGQSQNQFPQGGYPGQQQQYAGQQYGGQQQPNNQNEEIEAAVKKYLPRLLRKLDGCCIVM